MRGPNEPRSLAWVMYAFAIDKFGTPGGVVLKANQRELHIQHCEHSYLKPESETKEHSNGRAWILLDPQATSKDTQKSKLAC